MKKSIISVALVLSFASALFGLEWGGIVDNATNASTGDFKSVSLNQSNGVHFNISGNITDDKSLRFAAEAMYKINIAAEDKDVEIKNIVDLSLLKLSGSWNINGSLLSLNAGRFNYFDKTGFVFGQQCDGINVTYATRNWSAGVYAGYTGLLNRFTTPMYANEDVKQHLIQLYDLSYGYIPLMADFTLTNVGGNVIGLQGEYFLDIANKNDKAYGSLFVKGPLGTIGSYYVAGTIGSNKFKDVMVRANMNLQFVLGTNLMFGAGVDYASGNETLAPFTGITIKPVHAAVEGVDAIVPRLSCTYAGNNFVVSLTEKVVTSIPESFKLNGVDSNVSVVYNVFSDLQLSSAVSAYTDFNEKDNNQFSISINANFAF